MNNLSGILDDHALGVEVDQPLEFPPLHRSLHVFFLRSAGMPPDPRADDIVRGRYAMVAHSLRASAQGIDDARKARTLLMWADHYERLAVTPERAEPARSTMPRSPQEDYGLRPIKFGETELNRSPVQTRIAIAAAFPCPPWVLAV